MVCDVANHGAELADVGADRWLAAGLAVSGGELAFVVMERGLRGYGRSRLFRMPISRSVSPFDAR